MSFPFNRVHIHRTRFGVHPLDNLLHSPRSTGRPLDGYISAYLPDKVILLFLRRGDVISAVSFTEMDGRGSHARALRDIGRNRAGDLAYCDATLSSWLGCTPAAPPRPAAAGRRSASRRSCSRSCSRAVTGVLELIPRPGQLTSDRGRETRQRLLLRQAGSMTVPQVLESLFQAGPRRHAPVINASVFAAHREIPSSVPRYDETFPTCSGASPRRREGSRGRDKRPTRSATRWRPPTRAADPGNPLDGDRVPW